MIDNGVESYVELETTVKVYFPVDRKGVAHICCRQCPMFRSTVYKCGINGAVCWNPEHYVGANCPLKETNQTPEWISVNERLPELIHKEIDGDAEWVESDPVLVCTNKEAVKFHSHICTCVYVEDEKGKYWDIDDNGFPYDGEVTHWMPLPKLPERKGENVNE